MEVLSPIPRALPAMKTLAGCEIDAGTCSRGEKNGEGRGKNCRVGFTESSKRDCSRRGITDGITGVCRRFECVRRLRVCTWRSKTASLTGPAFFPGSSRAVSGRTPSEVVGRGRHRGARVGCLVSYHGKHHPRRFFACCFHPGRSFVPASASVDAA